MVAYRQPVPRADVEAVRGVGCGELLTQLMEKGLVKIVGRQETLGRPVLYGTTKKFLQAFGLGRSRTCRGSGPAGTADGPFTCRPYPPIPATAGGPRPGSPRRSVRIVRPRGPRNNTFAGCGVEPEFAQVPALQLGTHAHGHVPELGPQYREAEVPGELHGRDFRRTLEQGFHPSHFSRRLTGPDGSQVDQEFAAGKVVDPGSRGVPSRPGPPPSSCTDPPATTPPLAGRRSRAAVARPRATGAGGRRARRPRANRSRPCSSTRGTQHCRCRRRFGRRASGQQRITGPPGRPGRSRSSSSSAAVGRGRRRRASSRVQGSRNNSPTESGRSARTSRHGR